MKRLLRRSAAVPLALALLASVPALAGSRSPKTPDDRVLRCNSALLQAVRNVRSNPVVTARALAIVHTAMYDAWAAYDRATPGRSATSTAAAELHGGAQAPPEGGPGSITTSGSERAKVPTTD